MSTGRALLGIAFVAIGVLVLLDQAGAVEAGEIIADWWPVILLAAAGLELLVRPPRRIAAAVLAILGVLLLGVTTGLMGASVWAVVWPMLIIGLGLWLILRPSPFGEHRAGVVGAERIDVTAVFSGRRVTSTAVTLTGGTATAVFGGVELDLTEASIEGEAVFDLVALFGGIDVEVPPGWRVLLDGPAVFGGHENHVPSPSDPRAPTLRLRATAIFGGIDVKVVAPVDPVPV